MLDGVGDYFEEDIKVEGISRGKTGNNEYYLEVKVTTQKATGGTKHFVGSKIMSLGFIKNISVQISLLSSIIITLVSFAVTGFNISVPALAVIFVVSFVVIFTASKLVLAPLDVLKQELKKLKDERPF